MKTFQLFTEFIKLILYILGIAQNIILLCIIMLINVPFQLTTIIIVCLFSTKVLK